jgi:hypothetical protein
MDLLRWAGALVLFLLVTVGCSVEDDDGEPVCEPLQTKCEGIDVVRCNASGSGWELHAECRKYCTDGACVEACTPDCTGRECGDDGCGSPCGSCGAGLSCQDGACLPEGCTADCAGKQCGEDGCGGSCGSCEGAFDCQAGLCVDGPCTPDCDGMQCGDDGCGGSCGSCGDDQECSAGACQAASLPFCNLKCNQASDCDSGTGAAYSADNYVCQDGYCTYTGCNADAECVEMTGNAGYGCYQGQGYPIPYCTLKCNQPADCDQGTGGAFSADNYHCVEGFCEYTGCTSDAECAESFNNSAYGCN